MIDAIRRRDLATGVATLLVGLGTSYDARHLAWFSTSNVPGPGFLPRSMAFLLCLLGILQCVSAMRAKPSTALVPTPETIEAEDQVEGARSRRGLVVLLCFAGGIVLVRYVGFLIAMVAMILVLLFLVERRRSLWAVVVAVAIPLIAYALFAHLFAIPLPLGPVTTG